MFESMNEMTKNFFIARAKAINDYAHYETALLFLFSHFLGAAIDYAGIPFFQLNNAHARIIILDKLLKKKYGNTYNKFWDSLGGTLRELDVERNHIVHWVTQATIKDGKVVDIGLIAPNVLDWRPGHPRIDLDRLNAFMEQCAFFSQLLAKFWSLLHGQKLPDAWRDIFQQPVVYPPPESHPLYKKPLEFETPPQSSPQ